MAEKVEKPTIRFHKTKRDAFAIDSDGVGQIIVEVDGSFVFTLESELVWITKWEAFLVSTEDESIEYRKVTEQKLANLIARSFP